MCKKLSKILVTGGAGFIGSEFVRQGIKKGHKIVIVDKLTYAGDLKRLKEVKGKYIFYKVDICNRKKIEEILKKEKPEVIVNFAAESIPENIYIPVQSTPKIGTRIITFGALWEEQSKNNKLQKTSIGEVIFLRRSEEHTSELQSH